MEVKGSRCLLGSKDEPVVGTYQKSCSRILLEKRQTIHTERYIIFLPCVEYNNTKKRREMSRPLRRRALLCCYLDAQVQRKPCTE